MQTFFVYLLHQVLSIRIIYFKSLSILGYYIGYLLLLTVLDHIYFFTAGFSHFIIVDVKHKEPHIVVRVTFLQSIK